ncbi:hypothetical protein JCM8547_007561 [Rhodosporidiobolus lusitaniae]
MQAQCHLKNALAAKERSVGFWLTLPGTALARTIATAGKFQWALVDAEHGQITDKDYYELNNTLTSCGVSPIIRIPSSEAWLIKRALDSGAHGIMVPMVHNVEIAKRVVSNSKFAPVGTRGCGSPFTHQIFGVVENEYEVTCNYHLLNILQIESQEGLDNVEEIAKVPGADVIFVGPFDLAKSMDVEFGSEKHEAAIARILKATKDAGKIASIFCMSGEKGRARLDQGFDMVSISMDTDALIFEFQRQLEAVRGKKSSYAASSSHTGSTPIAATADDFNIANCPRPFKNPYYSRGTSTVGARKNKSLKHVLTLERERIDKLLEERKAAALAKVEEELGVETEEESEMKREERRRRQDQAVQEVIGDVVSYASVEAPPSLLPQKRYCDVTGLEAKYLDPKSTLRYYNPEVYEVLRGFQPAVIQAYLAVRGMGVVLR